MTRQPSLGDGAPKTRDSRAVGSDYALVFSGDDGYARGLAVAMYSSLTHLSSAVMPGIYVLDGGLSRSSRSRLLRVLAAVGSSNAVQWIPIPSNERLVNLGCPLSTWSPGTTSRFARMLIPELLPRHIQRAVYLDADVLVRRDLSPLFTIGLGASLVGAVRDFAIGTTAHEWSKASGLSPSHISIRASS